MSYESPIEIICGNIESRIENGVYNVVQSYGINVDKDELIKALEYDRKQYQQGYADAKAELERKWIPVTETLPLNDIDVLVTVRDDSGDTPWEYTSVGWRTPDGRYWVVDNNMCYGVIAWMPLPEPWRGE